MEQHILVRQNLLQLGMNVCGNVADKPRFGCYCDYCVILRVGISKIDVDHLLKNSEIRMLESGKQ